MYCPGFQTRGCAPVLPILRKKEETGEKRAAGVRVEHAERTTPDRLPFWCWCPASRPGSLDRMKYQLLPDLNQAEYLSLKAHIAVEADT
jgi:hypothetical protein